MADPHDVPGGHPVPHLGLALLAFFSFGATTGFLAGFSNSIYAGFGAPLLFVDTTLFIIFLVAIVAPIVEENVKVSGLMIQKKRMIAELPIFYWALFGMVSGLGFAILEDYIYFQLFFLEFTLEESLHLLLMRLSFPVHMLGSALGGLGVGLWKKTDDVRYFVCLIAIAILIHSSFNFLMTVGVY